jgi:hypothetical protein
MDTLQHHRAMEAFCRQHAKMDGEDPAFWLAEAEHWARRAASLHAVIRLQPESDVDVRRLASRGEGGRIAPRAPGTGTFLT